MRTARATVVMSVAGWLEQNASAERVLRFRKLVARVRGDHEALVALVSEAFYDHDRHEAISCQVRLNVEKLLVTTIPAMPNAAALSRLECQSGVRLAVNAALTVN